MRLIFNTIFKFFLNFRNEFSICFLNFCNKIIKICLSFLNFSKIILFKYCRLKFYFYLTQFLKYFSFILYTSKYFYNWLGPPGSRLAPPPEYKFWLRPWNLLIAIIITCSVRVLASKRTAGMNQMYEEC